MCERFVYMVAVPTKSEEGEPDLSPLYRRLQEPEHEFDDGNHNFEWGIWNDQALAEAELDGIKRLYPDTEYFVKKIPVMGSRRGGVG